MLHNEREQWGAHCERIAFGGGGVWKQLASGVWGLARIAVIFWFLYNLLTGSLHFALVAIFLALVLIYLKLRSKDKQNAA